MVEATEIAEIRRELIEELKRSINVTKKEDGYYVDIGAGLITFVIHLSLKGDIDEPKNPF